MLYNRLAVILAEAGRLDEAREALRQALALDPGLEVARRNLERIESLPPPRPR
jgi:Flp pilus assembly protein TadD